MILRVPVSALLLWGVVCLSSTARAASPVADYRFQNSLASSISGAPDLEHLVDATNQQQNTFVTAAVDGANRTVLHFPQFNGVVLSPTTGLVANGVYSVVILFSFEETIGYRRILDFKNGVTDNGVYTLSSRLNFYPITSSDAEPITPNAFHQVVMTRNGSGIVTGYVDGAPALTFDDSNAKNGVIDENNRLRFFQDNTGGNAPVRESSAGAVARIRLYDVALSAEEVAALDRLPGVSPDRVRLLKIVGGLESATPEDVARWDTNGDQRLTLADVAAILRS